MPIVRLALVFALALAGCQVPSQAPAGVAGDRQLPAPVANADGTRPMVVELVSMEPPAGFRLQVTRPEGEPPALAFTPAEPTAHVVLKAPPGSAGTTIRSLSVAYAWKEGEADKQSDPAEVPLSRPIVVQPAEMHGYGPAAELDVPLPLPPLRAIFEAGSPERLVASVRLIDDQGYEVQDRNLESLAADVLLLVD